MRYVCRAIWNTAEVCNVNLGRFAPFVFHHTIGAKSRKQVV